MNTLGFDPSSTYWGWSYFAAGVLLSAGTWKLNSKPDSYGLRWTRLLRHLQNIKRSGIEFEMVAYEESTFGSVEKGGWLSVQLRGGAKAILELWFESLNFPSSRLVAIHVADVKKVALGKGSGRGTDKPAMLPAARERWPRVAIPDHHCADACWVAQAAIDGMHLKRAAKRRERAATPRRHKHTKPRPRQLALPDSGRS